MLHEYVQDTDLVAAVAVADACLSLLNEINAICFFFFPATAVSGGFPNQLSLPQRTSLANLFFSTLHLIFILGIKGFQENKIMKKS